MILKIYAVRASFTKRNWKQVSAALTDEFGNGFSVQNLYSFRQFYLTFPEIFSTPWRILTWSHYKRIMHVTNEAARNWYIQEASEQMWSYATLNRNQDVGQMKMYVNMYDKKVRGVDDNPTLGIVLCSETDEDIAEYWLNDEQNIFMSKYLLMLPSKTELKQEIEQQKAIFALQQGKKED